MKSYLTNTTLALCLLSMSALAAPGQADKHNPQARLNHLMNELGLDQLQAEQVHEILHSQHQQIRALHQQQREASKDDVCAIRADTHTQLAGILNDQQLAAFEAMPKPHERPARRSGAAGRGHSPVDCSA